jgi:LmbE family N-acetylglucosaminyl deacetylase
LSSAAVDVLGVDGTEEMTAVSTLIVAPHPDDETFGCGATIARMRARGTDVHVLFLTGGGSSPRPRGVSAAHLIELRRSEAVHALGILGVDPSFITHLDFDDGSLSRHSDDLSDALADVLRTTKPDQVLVTSRSDRHPDHVAAAGAARAVVPHAGREVRLYEFPIWQRLPAFTCARGAAQGVWDRSGAPQPRGRPMLVRTDDYLTLKERAIRAYESQLDHFPLGFREDFLLPFEMLVEIAARRRSPN